MPDPATLGYYERTAVERVARFEAAQLVTLHPQLLAACPPRGRALDVGCGSGRDVAFLVANGRDARGVDASPAMLAEARRVHPEVADRLTEGALPELRTVPAGERFDLVACTAVLMHLSADELAPAIARLAQLVAPTGSLICSIPELPPDTPDRDGTGRLFRPGIEPPVTAMAKQAGLTLRARRADGDGCGRRRTWVVLEFGRVAGAGPRVS